MGQRFDVCNGYTDALGAALQWRLHCRRLRRW
jgi:hypothetical protein